MVTGVLAFVNTQNTPDAVTVAVALPLEVATTVEVRATPPGSVHPSVKEGNVLEEDAACVIYCAKDMRIVLAAVGVKIVLADPLL